MLNPKNWSLERTHVRALLSAAQFTIAIYFVTRQGGTITADIYMSSVVLAGQLDN
jgi:hypothetical protein